MKKIVFGITSLNLGGAERVLIDLANELSSKYDVTIFTLYGNGEFEKELNNKVKRISYYQNKYNELSKKEKILISFKMLIPFFRRKIYNEYIKEKFDIEVAFLEGPITWIFSSKGNSKKIAWVHNDIMDVFKKDKMSFIKTWLNKKCYQKYDKLVFVSQDNLNKFKSSFKKNRVPKDVIYNYLNSKNVLEKSSMFDPKEIDKKCISFVQISRLVEQKAVGRLLKVHKRLIDEGYFHKIYIIGDGPLMGKLKAQVKEQKNEDTFILMGKKENPYPYLNKANYFLLTSYYEGYGMVIDEAKILNKFIIITDSAAREAVNNYQYSEIVENSENGIYEGLKKAIVENKFMKNRYSYQNDSLNEIISLMEEK